MAHAREQPRGRVVRARLGPRGQEGTLYSLLYYSMLYTLLYCMIYYNML